MPLLKVIVRFHPQVLMNLQLYMVDSINYLVDFHHKGTYRASNEPGSNRFDMAVSDPLKYENGSGDEEVRSMKDLSGPPIKPDDVISPFVFMDTACKLILELAGGSE